MDFIHQQDIEELVAPRTGPCLSFYIPFYPGSRDAQGDITRLQNIARRAKDELTKRGMQSGEADSLLTSLLRLPGDAYEWRHRGQGIAAFSAPQFFRVFRVLGELREELFVNDHFHLRPLLPLVNAGDEFFVLALSQTGQRLLKGNARGLEEAHPLALESPRGTPIGSGPFVDRGDSGVKPGDPPDVLEADGDLRTHLLQIAQAVDRRLQGETAPLVLVSDEQLAAIYRTVSQYRHLHDRHVNGSPNSWSAEEIHARAWPLVEPALVQNREAHRKRMLLHRDGEARHGLADVIPAAMQGRIDALFIDCSRPRWGHFEPNGEIELHARPRVGDDDLVELAVAETLRHRGQVFAVKPEQVEMENEAEALLRY